MSPLRSVLGSLVSRFVGLCSALLLQASPIGGCKQLQPRCANCACQALTFPWLRQGLHVRQRLSFTLRLQEQCRFLQRLQEAFNDVRALLQEEVY